MLFFSSWSLFFFTWFYIEFKFRFKHEIKTDPIYLINYPALQLFRIRIKNMSKHQADLILYLYAKARQQ